MFTRRFPTPDGRARFLPVNHRAPAEDVDDVFPLYLTTGRVTAHYQGGAQTRRIRALSEAAPDAYVEVHPAQAELLDMAEGETVRVVTRRVRARGRNPPAGGPAGARVWRPPRGRAAPRLRAAGREPPDTSRLEVTTVGPYLSGAEFPATRQELRTATRRNGAPPAVVARVEALPQERFNGMNVLTEALLDPGPSR